MFSKISLVLLAGVSISSVLAWPAGPAQHPHMASPPHQKAQHPHMVSHPHHMAQHSKGAHH